VANFIGHVNFFPGEVADLSGGEMTFNISQGSLKLDMPQFPVSVGDKLRAVVRPESIDIVAAENEVTETKNVMEGSVEGAMYIGSVVRFTIAVGDQIITVDEADPQYSGMFQENQRVKLILKKRIHMLKSEEHD
jgi:ABC-type Fe3+/spermidine/putrescine transport system ATPase subunit